MSKCKKHSDDKLVDCDVDCKSRENKAGADTSSCSDSDDFEKLSMPDSETMSDDEVIADSPYRGHVLHAMDVAHASETAQIVPVSFTVQKPPAALTAPMPSVHDKVCHQTLGSGRVEISQVSTDLIALANNVQQLMAAEIKSEVEKEMRLERVEFEMQKAGYEQKIAHLQAKFHQQTAEVDKSRSSSSYQYNDRQPESVQETLHRQLQQANHRLSHRCAKQEHEITMLQQQAAEANRQMKEREDELFHLRSMFSAARVPALQQQKPTFEIVQNSSMEPLPTKSPSRTRSPEVWSCARCTYDNPTSVKKCEMCELPRMSGGQTLQC